MDILGRDPLSMLNALGRVPIPFRDELPGDELVRGQLGEAWDILDALGFDEMFLGQPAYDEFQGQQRQINAGAAPIVPWGGFMTTAWGGKPMIDFLKGGAHRMGPARSQMDELVRQEKLRELRNIFGDRELGLDTAMGRVFGQETKNIRSLPSLSPNQEHFRRYQLIRREEGASQGEDIWDALMQHRDLAREMKKGIRGVPELDPRQEAFRRYLLKKRGEIDVPMDVARTKTGKLRMGRTKAWEDQRLMDIENLEDIHPESLAYKLHQNMSTEGFHEYADIARKEAERIRNAKLQRMTEGVDFDSPDLFRTLRDRISDYDLTQYERFIDARIRASEVIGSEAERAGQKGDFARAARLAKLRLEYEFGTPRAKMERFMGNVWNDVPRPSRLKEPGWFFRPHSMDESGYLADREFFLKQNFRFFNKMRRNQELRRYPR